MSKASHRVEWMHTEAVFEATEGDKTGGGVLASPTAS
jgi:hypothetical protein